MKPTPEMIKAAIKAFWDNTGDHPQSIEAALTAALALVETGEPVPPFENDAVWARFYRDGKNLKEIAEEFQCGVYDLSPWLMAPINRAALASPPLPAVEAGEPAIEIDDGCVTIRLGTKSITIFAETATVYDVGKDEPARKVPLTYEELSKFEDALASPPPPSQADDGKDAELQRRWERCYPSKVLMINGVGHYVSDAVYEAFSSPVVKTGDPLSPYHRSKTGEDC